MIRYGSALRLVFANPSNILLGAVTCVGGIALLSWAGQVVTRFQYGGLYWDLQPGLIAAIIAMSAGLGVVLPIQVEVVRRLRARAIARAGAGLAATSLGGIAAVSCCAPLLIPTIAGLLGASGTTILSLNLGFHRWFVPLTLASLAILAASGAAGLRDLVRGCRVDQAQRVGNEARHKER